MVKRTIEFACSHNHGRSPLAEAFAKRFLDSEGIKMYNVISSGTRVNEINDILASKGAMPEYEFKATLELALQRGLIKETQAISNVLSGNPISEQDMNLLQDYARKTLNLFVEEEHAYREEAFRQLGLGTPKLAHDQTVISPDTILFLGMGKSHVQPVTKMYELSYTKPEIVETLAGYAEYTPGLEFTSGFGGTLQSYLEMAEVIRGHTNKALERALREL